MASQGLVAVGGAGAGRERQDLAAVAAHADAIDARLHAVERLIKLFALERYVYLAISIVSFIALLGSAAYAFVGSSTSDQGVVLGLLFAAPGGALVYVTSQFLKMWTQALHVFGGSGAGAS